MEPLRVSQAPLVFQILSLSNGYVPSCLHAGLILQRTPGFSEVSAIRVKRCSQVLEELILWLGCNDVTVVDRRALELTAAPPSAMDGDGGDDDACESVPTGNCCIGSHGREGGQRTTSFSTPTSSLDATSNFEVCMAQCNIGA